jgi:ABC-2 type transport system permease protein
VWFNPNQLDSWFMGITELLNIVTVFSILLPAAAMVREKERGTVEQLLVSPLSPFQIVFPKVLAMTLVIVLGSALALFGVLQLGFAVPVRGSAVLFLLLTALYVFTTAGLGLAAATLARNLAQVGMLSILILAPMIFLSGAWTPPEAMPAWLRALTYLSPMHYYIDAAFGVLLKGQGALELWRSLLGMTLIGVTVFVWGLRRVRMG